MDANELAGEVHSRDGERVHVHRAGTFIPLMQVEGEEVFQVVCDHLGMPKELIGEGNRVTWSAVHSAWGNVQEEWFDDGHERGKRVASPFRLLGQYYDEETGLGATRFRYFESGTGRWLSGDPLGRFGGENLFAFDGKPTGDVDPLGLACEDNTYAGNRRNALKLAKERAGVASS